MTWVCSVRDFMLQDALEKLGCTVLIDDRLERVLAFMVAIQHAKDIVRNACHGCGVSSCIRSSTNGRISC